MDLGINSELVVYDAICVGVRLRVIDALDMGMGALNLDSNQSNIFPGLQDFMKDAATFATYVAHNG